METQGFNQELYLKQQMKYLGFGESEKLHKDLEKGLNSTEKQFQLKVSSEKTLLDNVVDYTLKFNKADNGRVYFNSYNAEMTNNDGNKIEHNFAVKKENNLTAKEALNLLEGRSVKTQFVNPTSNEKENVFIKLKLNDEKTEYGNFKLEYFNQNHTIDTAEILEHSGIKIDKPEFKDNIIKSLEKGNIVQAKFNIDSKEIEGKAVLNPQYNTINLYDKEMNRLNTNQPLKGLEAEIEHKNNLKNQYSISRGI